MTTLLFLDDERSFEDVTWVKYPKFDNVITVRTSAQFEDAYEQLLETSDDWHVSFDHDINEFSDSYNIETTGYDILKCMLRDMLDINYPIPVCYFHTQNPTEKKNMEMFYLKALEAEK